jgi:hypothetical protein
MALPFQRTMLPLDQIRAELERSAESYCAKLEFPAEFDEKVPIPSAGYDPFRYPHHKAADKALKRFLPRNERQLRQLLAQNDGVELVRPETLIRDLDEATSVLRSNAYEIFREHFAENNRLAALARREAAEERRVAEQRRREPESSQREGDMKAVGNPIAKPSLSDLDAASATRELDSPQRGHDLG